MNRNKDIAIGISTFLRDESLFKLVTSILKYLPEFKIYIADGGRKSKQKDAIYKDLRKQKHHIEYITFDSGISKTRKILKKRCKEKYLVYMEDDFEVTSETNLYKLQEILEENPEIGIVGGNLEKYPVTGAYSFFLDRLEDKIIYLPLDYLLNKKLVQWESTSKGTRFLRADIVSDFTMWRKEVPNIFDENVKTIEHTDVYLLVKTKTKYKVAFCPESEIRHAHNTNESQEYNQYRARKEELEYLKNYWNVNEFYQIKSSQLRKLEQITVEKSRIEADVPTIVVKNIENFKTDHETCLDIIRELQRNNIDFFLTKVSCLNTVFKHKLKLPLQLEVKSNKAKQTLEESIGKKYLDIEVDSKYKQVKFFDVDNLKIPVPCPVITYLEEIFKKNWIRLQSENN